MNKLAFFVAAAILVAACSESEQIVKATVVEASSPTTVNFTVAGSLIKKLLIDIDNPQHYASIGLYADGELLVNNLNVPRAGNQILNALVRFNEPGDVRLTLKANNATLVLNSLQFEDTENLDIPLFRDASDEGGMRFWLRHFRSEWFPVKDIVLTDSDVLKTESGSSSMTFSLQGLTPTAELPDGQFYLLRASFATNDGSVHDESIYPIDIVATEPDKET